MRTWLALPLCLLPLTAGADTAADKGFLTNWLQDNLSGAGRVVTIDGFQGALSSQASLTQLTIADDQGIWLTLKDVTLDWSRSALFAGNIQINELSAGEIDLERLPTFAPGPSVPSPEAKPLALPDLPVSIAIKGIAAHKIVLGASILGQPLEASLTADLTLSGGEGTSHLDLQRLGAGPQGHVTLAASFSNATQVLDLNLDAAEGAGGVAASLLHVPGAPATSLTIAGKGPLSDFAATVNLSTDGQTRLAGKITQTDDAKGNRSFSADLSGDPSPVFLPQYAGFFGPDVALQASGQRSADGTLRLDTLLVQARALSLRGSMILNAGGQPDKLDFKGTLGLPDGPVTLPTTSDQPIKIGHADLSLTYDKSYSEDWNFGATVKQFDGASLTAGLLQVTANGRLNANVFDGKAQFAAASLAPRDAGLAAALGSTLSGSADFSWNSATSALDLANLALTAPGYALTTQGSIGKLAEVTGKASGHYDDLSRLSTLTGRPLSGAARFDLQGSVSPTSGAFDLSGNLSGTKLAVGIPQVDALLSGESSLQISAKRDETGTVLRQFALRAASLSTDLTGTLTKDGGTLAGSLSFADLSALGAGYRGSLSGSGTFTGTLSTGSLTAQAQGQDIAIGQAQADGILAGSTDLRLDATFDNAVVSIKSAQISSAHGQVALSGTASAKDSDLKARISLPDLSVMGAGYRGALEGDFGFAGAADNGVLTLEAKGSNLAIGQPQADTLLRGASTVSAKLALTADGMRIEKADLANLQLRASVAGSVAGSTSSLKVSAQLANLGLLYPQFPGALTVSGTAQQAPDGLTLDLTAKGPGQIDTKMAGKINPGYSSANLAISGSATAALANAFVAPRSMEGAVRFDLKLAGPLSIASLSGPVRISGGRLADPTLPFSLKDLTATATLGGGRMQIAATTGVSTGGTVGVKGALGLSAPYTADLAITLDQVTLKDPQLFATTVNGDVSFRGPAAGGAAIAGQIALSKTELQIPSTGMVGGGDLPGLKHVNDSAAVKATRTRAGIGASTATSRAGPGYALDLTISAPNQVFVRGRGLDAELGGTLVLKGTTDNIVPSGALNLIRGRLDILGRRLVLSEAQIQMQGALVPFIHVLASVDSDGITASILIEGDATDPKVTFTSTPELPQEEVVARLLFNRGLDTMSAFQAVQLASAVAKLAGKGGEGVIGSLRRKTGLDNLDVQSDAAGNTTVTAGKYLSDKTYSEVTVDQGGKSSISLNYDLAPHITIKGHVDSDSSTGVGIFLQRDY
ncbi:translocation and assembly module protein TamB [bacterium]|nr:translocation and assembly module protein TamB [bacterium]